MANFHLSLAGNLQARAKQLRGLEQMRERTQARVDYLEASALVVLEYLAKGYNSPESAIEAAARELDLKPDAVAGWYRLWLKKRDAVERDKRDAIIMRLVHTGLTNYEISRRIGIHTNTISRAITRHLHGDLRPVDRARLRKRRKVTCASTQKLLPEQLSPQR